jgi:hypothetical protein
MRLVIRLPLHPEYRPRENLNDSGLDIEVEETPLTQYLKLSGENDLVKTLFYCDMPLFYHWSSTKCEWVRNTKLSITRGHMMPEDFNNRELESLRYLLINRKGCDSFKSLRTVDGKEYDTFSEAELAILSQTRTQ